MALDLGIDLGTSRTRICEGENGIVLDEPSLVIKSDADDKIVAIGEEASDMIGRTPEGVSAITPIRGGAITGFYATASMLKYFVKKIAGSPFARVRAVISVPCGINEVERRAVYEAANEAGINETVLVDAPLAAAVGCGIDTAAPRGSMVVSIGAGVCEAAVISLNGIVVSKTIKTAGVTFDNAIIQHIKKQYNMVIGDSVAEGIKISIGSVYSGITSEIVDINGRDMVSGLPKTAKISTDEIRICLTEYADTIVETVRATLEETPPELASDVMQSGIVLTGGGSLLRGLGRQINVQTEIPVYMSENPVECTAIGAGKSLERLIEKNKKSFFSK